MLWYDHARTHRDLLRLARWHALERPGQLTGGQVVAEATARKIEAISVAQASGVVATGVTAAELLDTIMNVSASAASGGIEGRSSASGAQEQVAARAVVVELVRRLTDPR